MQNFSVSENGSTSLSEHRHSPFHRINSCVSPRFQLWTQLPTRLQRLEVRGDDASDINNNSKKNTPEHQTSESFFFFNFYYCLDRNFITNSEEISVNCKKWLNGFGILPVHAHTAHDQNSTAICTRSSLQQYEEG